MNVNVSLLDHLADALPRGISLRVYHTSSLPTPSSAIFSAAPDQIEEQTCCESHFLGIASAADDPGGGEVLVYAIEILIFTTKKLTTLFISKADSSGFLHLLKPPKDSQSVIRTITTRFIEHLISQRLERSRLVVSLFARSQNQYLFPGSIENSSKHVLDDRQLIKWWCRTLDPIVRHTKIAAGQKAPIAHVIVPGCDRSETRTFFPVSARSDLSTSQKWVCSYPVEQLTDDTSAPTRCLIPRLPDDPKARFLDDLDGEHVGERGQWRSVSTLDQFWEMMSYRQECSAGRLVGFIWVTFEPDFVANQIEDFGENVNETPLPTTNEHTLHTSEPSQAYRTTPHIPSALDTHHFASTGLPGSPPPSSPATLPQPGHIALTSGAKRQASDDIEGKLKASVPNWSPNKKGELILDATGYQVLIDYLLELDFAGQELATENTSRWIKKAADLAHVNSWGESLIGRSAGELSIGERTFEAQPTNVNVLTTVRKKRKAEAVNGSPQKVQLREAAATTLSSGLVRKKPKT